LGLALGPLIGCRFNRGAVPLFSRCLDAGMFAVALLCTAAASDFAMIYLNSKIGRQES
jgi:hypothetical protein